MYRSRSQIILVGLIVCVLLGTLTAVVVTLVFASTQAALLVGIIGTMVVPVVTGMLNLAQGSATAAKVDGVQATTDAVKTQTDGQLSTLTDSLATTHQTIQSLAERLKQ